jgi:hypothetical protein
MPDLMHPAKPPIVAHAERVAALPADIRALEAVDTSALSDTAKYAMEKTVADLKADLRSTDERLLHDQAATELCDKLGLTNVITPTTITHNDAVNFVARTLHAIALGEKRSHYQRGHAHLVGINDGAHADMTKMTEAWDPAAEVVEHLALTDPAHVSMVRELFAQKVVA